MNAQERKKKKKDCQGFHPERKNKKSTKQQGTDGAVEEIWSVGARDAFANASLF